MNSDIYYSRIKRSLTHSEINASTPTTPPWESSGQVRSSSDASIRGPRPTIAPFFWWGRG